MFLCCWREERRARRAEAQLRRVIDCLDAAADEPTARIVDSLDFYAAQTGTPRPDAYEGIVYDVLRGWVGEIRAAREE